MDSINVTNLLLEQYEKYPKDILGRKPEEAPPDMSANTAEMFVMMAAHAVYQIDSGPDKVDYEDFKIPVVGLALTSCLVACEASVVGPSFDRPRAPNPWVREAFRRQLMAELNREQEARLRQGIWSCWYERKSDLAHHRLTRRRRLSALTLIDNHAQPALLQQLTNRPLADLSVDEVHHVIAASPEILSFIVHTDPSGWAKFENEAGVDLRGMTALTGFLYFLDFAADTVGHSYWYDEDFLKKLWGIYITAYPKYSSINANTLINSIKSFSLPPSEAAKCLLHPPFFYLHGRFLRNPCFLEAHNPIAALLIIAIRRNEKAWSRTLGSSLALAADTLAAMMEKTDRMKVSVRRKYPGGDVDLALYDVQTEELLICEVKTVFDKHRTDSLMYRFEQSKVNVQRAASQLRSTKHAIESGELTLKQLVGIEGASPKCVHMALLTWLDPIDVTMGTPDEDILSLNFATFLWLVRACAGDVQAFAVATRELRNIWCVAITRSLDLGQPELTADVEVQRHLLDTRSDIAALPLSSLTLNIIEQLKSIDDVSSDHNLTSWISYIEDTREALT